MELGADRKSLAQLGVALAVLAGVVYYQFLRSPAEPTASGGPAAAEEGPSRPVPDAGTSRRGGRFQARLGRGTGKEAPDPLTADATLRSDLLEQVRSIAVPTVERDIFNFGRPPRPKPQPPTPAEARLAQQRLEAALQKPPPAPKPAKPPPEPPYRPPSWKYFGMASQPGAERARAFLLDGEEVLVATGGSVLRDRYRLDRVGAERVVLTDLQAEREFSIALEGSP